MKVSYTFIVYNDYSCTDFTNIYHLSCHNTLYEAMKETEYYSDMTWQIIKETEHLIDDPNNIENKNNKCETHFELIIDEANEDNYSTYHLTIQSAKDEADRYINNEHHECHIMQIDETIVMQSIDLIDADFVCGIRIE